MADELRTTELRDLLGRVAGRDRRPVKSCCGDRPETWSD